MSSKVLCLYHDDCPDGLGAAWALSKRFPDAEFLPVRYNEPAPDVLDRDVYIVDFCYPIEELRLMLVSAASLHVFDHHKGMDTTIAQFNLLVRDLGLPRKDFCAIFDASRSGAKLTWEQLMPGQPVPQILEHISDRDLWAFELEDTKAVMAGLGTYEMSLRTWDALFRWEPNDWNEPDGPHMAGVDMLEAEGRPILRKMQQDINRIRALSERTIELGGHTVPFINVPRTLISETLEQAAIGQPFAVGYFDGPDYREFSLRSTKGEGINLIELAQSLGGNGHPHAAGFRVPRGEPLAQI